MTPWDKLKCGQISVYEAAMELDVLSNLSCADRKNKGVTYTPWDVAYKIVEQVNPRYDETWLDTSIGRGAFLWATLSFLEAQGATNEQLQYFLDHGLHAVELDVKAAQDCEDLLVCLCLAKGLTVPQRSWLLQGDSLEQKLPCVDVIVGNPPYVRIHNIDVSAKALIRQKYISCASGNVDLYYAFFEQALSTARRGALIAPNSWLRNTSAILLRRLLALRTTKVIDFYNTLLFNPIRAYTAVWVWDEASKCSQIITRQEGWDVNKAVTQLRKPIIENNGQVWPDPLRVISSKLLENLVPCHTLAEVRSGIATLADKIYTVKLNSYDGFNKIWSCIAYTGEILNLHEDMLVPLYKWTKDFNATGLKKDSNAIIYPYDESGVIFTPEKIQTCCVETWNYLVKQKEKLVKRDNGNGNYAYWYAYGRKQGLYSKHKTAIGIPSMWSGICKPIEIINAKEPYVFVGGFVLIPREGVNMKQLINSFSQDVVWQQIVVQGRIWAGNKPYRSVGAPMIKDLKIPF